MKKLALFIALFPGIMFGASAAVVVVSHPVTVSVARAVTVAPVARPTVTAPAAHATVEPVTPSVTRSVTPTFNPALNPAFMSHGTVDDCNRERHQTGDCDN